MNSPSPRFYDEPPTVLEQAIALFERTGGTESVGSVHALSIRVPTIEYATIEGLARHSGVSRNKVICQLLAVALDEVWQGMSEDNRAGVQAYRSEIFREFMQSENHAQSVEGEI